MSNYRDEHGDRTWRITQLREHMTPEDLARAEREINDMRRAAETQVLTGYARALEDQVRIRLLESLTPEVLERLRQEVREEVASTVLEWIRLQLIKPWRDMDHSFRDQLAGVAANAVHGAVADVKAAILNDPAFQERVAEQAGLQMTKYVDDQKRKSRAAMALAAEE